uniref:Secreted protein n=1 Tax=Anopheles darlingi TaxID=43151 RepID=A0A2M4DJ47_ANODA
MAVLCCCCCCCFVSLLLLLLLLLSFKNLGNTTLPTPPPQRVFCHGFLRRTVVGVRSMPFSLIPPITINRFVWPDSPSPATVRQPPEKSLTFFDTFSVEGSNSVPESSEMMLLFVVVVEGFMMVVGGGIRLLRWA